MSTESVSTASNRQGVFKVATQHEEKLVRHATRNIKNADKLCDEVFQKQNTFTKRLPDKFDLSNNLKHIWS